MDRWGSGEVEVGVGRGGVDGRREEEAVVVCWVVLRVVVDMVDGGVGRGGETVRERETIRRKKWKMKRGEGQGLRSEGDLNRVVS